MSFRTRIALLSIAAIVALPSLAIAGGGGGGTNQNRETIGLFRSTSQLWILRSSNAASCATPTVVSFQFGDASDTPLAVDPDGDGIDQVAVFRDGGGFGTFFIRDDNGTAATGVTRIDFGAATDIPIAGNFDGADGDDEVGVFRDGVFFLNTSPVTEIGFGQAGDIPIVGNWDGSVDGSEELGLFRVSTGEFFIRTTNDPGNNASTLRFLGGGVGAGAQDQAAAGDWDGDDSATIAVFREQDGAAGVGVTFFNNMTTGDGATDILFFGSGGEAIISGDWDGPTVDEAGCSGPA